MQVVVGVQPRLEDLDDASRVLVAHAGDRVLDVHPSSIPSGIMRKRTTARTWATSPRCRRHPTRPASRTNRRTCAAGRQLAAEEHARVWPISVLPADLLEHALRRVREDAARVVVFCILGRARPRLRDRHRLHRLARPTGRRARGVGGRGADRDGRRRLGPGERFGPTRGRALGTDAATLPGGPAGRALVVRGARPARRPRRGGRRDGDAGAPA